MDMTRGFRDKLDNHLNTAQKFQVQMNIEGKAVYDFCCFGVDNQEKLSDDRYMIFYNQLSSPQGELSLQLRNNQANFTVDLSRLPQNIDKLVFVVSIDGSGIMRDIISHTVTISQNGRAVLKLNLTGKDFQQEKAIISVEIYRKNGWRTAAVARGFYGGLSALLEFYGGEEIKETPAQPTPTYGPSPSPTPKYRPTQAPAPTYRPAPTPAPTYGSVSTSTPEYRPSPAPNYKSTPTPTPVPAQPSAPPFQPAPAPAPTPAPTTVLPQPPAPPLRSAPVPGQIPVQPNSKGPISLTKGQSVNLKKNDGANLTRMMVGLGWDVAETNSYDIDCDASAFLCKNGKLSPGREDIVAFFNLSHSSGAVVHTGDNLTGEGENDKDDEQIIVDLTKIPAQYDKIVFVVNIYRARERGQHFGLVKNAFIRIIDDKGKEFCRYDIVGQDYVDKTALIFGEADRQGEAWKFKANGQATQDNSISELAGRFL